MSAKKRFTTLQEWELAEKKNVLGIFFRLYLRTDSHLLENTGTFLQKCLIREDRLTIFRKRYIDIAVKKVPLGKQVLKLCRKCEREIEI